jgi:UDP-glucose 4-epimerase
MMRVLITGAAGYVGSLLISSLEIVDDVTAIVGIDLKSRPERLAGARKLVWIQSDVSTDHWQEAVRAHRVDVVVHLAFQIRQLYGRQEALQHRWNIDGARKVFAFACNEPGVSRLIHFSTVSGYGAWPQNTLTAPFVESAALTESEYLYGRHKRHIEKLLEHIYAASGRRTHVLVLRCASISGPYGRFVLGRFGIVSTLTNLFPVIPCGRADFGRQYLHEDDAADVVHMLLTAPAQAGYEVFNVSPRDYLASQDLASFLGKRAVIIPPLLLRSTFALCWHASRGRVPTPRGAWRFVTYPIAVNGTRLTETYGYEYRFTSADALLAQCGRHSGDSQRHPGARPRRMEMRVGGSGTHPGAGEPGA